MLQFLQRIGRSLMVPIAVLPVAALLLRLGAPDMLDLPFLAGAGAAVFDNLALLFAIGIAIGMSADHRGEAVLAAVVGYLVIISATQALLTAAPPWGAGYSAGDDLVTRLGSNVLIGILAGLIAVWTYNRVRLTTLPTVLSFFSGRRLAPILTAIFVIIFAIPLRYIWPPLWNGLNALGDILLGWGAIGAAVYGTLNRVLLPFGLHHVLNTYFWFGTGDFVTGSGEVVIGDIPRFLNGDPTAGVYQVGFYPIMMGGLLGAALAMIVLARKEQRSKIFGLLGSAALISLVTGITEPLEFAFLFAAPLLFGIHALLTGVAMLVTNFMGLRHGFSFSAGLLDYFLNYHLAERPQDLAVVTGAFFLLYFALFYVLIRVLDLKTPGRETAGAPAVTGEDLQDVLVGVSDADDTLIALAQDYVAALGGPANILAIESCATRLSLTVADASLVRSDELRGLGAKGVIKPSQTAVQIVAGVEAGFLAAAMREVLSSKELSLVAAAAAPQPQANGEEAQPAPQPQPRPQPSLSAVHDPAVAASVNLMIKALGGPQNILEAQVAATTRLRVVVRDPARVKEDALRASGSSGVMALGNTYHILLGMNAAAYGEEMAERLAEAGAL